VEGEGVHVHRCTWRVLDNELTANDLRIRSHRVSVLLAYSPAASRTDADWEFRIYNNVAKNIELLTTNDPLAIHSAEWELRKDTSYTDEITVGDNDGGITFTTYTVCTNTTTPISSVGVSPNPLNKCMSK